MVLIDYLSFLKNNHADALAAENARLYKTRNISLLNFFKHLKDDEFIAGTKRGLIKLIEDFENGQAYEEVKISARKWVNNENQGFTREQVRIDDIINIYGAQKEALMHFVPLFTSESSVGVQIFKELEQYYSAAYQITVETFFEIQSDAIKRSEKKYRLLAENSSDIIARQTMEGIITYVSPSCISVLGYEPEEITGKQFSDFVHPDDLVQLVLLPPEPNQVETSSIRMERKDGIYIWIELTAKNVTDPTTEQPPEVHISARNINARKNAEEKLRRNEALLTESQRIAKIGSWEWNLKTNELTWTPEHYLLYGLQPGTGKIDYETAAVMRHPDDSPLIKEALGTAIKYNRPFEFAHRLIVNGAIRVLSVKGEVISQNGESKLRGTSQDITHMSHIQGEMVKKNRQLEEAQKIAHLGSWEWDTRVEKVVWSDEMYHLFGYEPGSVEVDFKFYLNRVFPADREKVESNINLCYTEGKPYSFENRIITKQGHIRWLLATGQVSERDANKILVLSGTAHDITERKNAALALDMKILDLEKSNNDLQLYASIASHDLKEPLRKIKTNVSILTDNHAHLVDPKIKKYIDRIEGSAIRMERIIEDVLSVSRISGKKGNLEKKDLNAVVSQCISDLEQQIKNRNVVIDMKKLPDDLLLNPDQMYQLFQNLITNSIKFNNKEQPLINISFEVGMPPGALNTPFHKYCNIFFSDNGIGFEQAYAEKIFLMFQRLHEKEKYEGNGIGLAICRRIVENHDGFIEASGEPDRGATFIISLPVRSEEYAYI